MTRHIQHRAIPGLVAMALVLAIGPGRAYSGNHGLFGTGLFDPVETVYVDPIETIYAVPTTYVTSTSYLIPTTSVVYRPTTYTVAPTVYLQETSLLDRLFPTRTVVERPVLSTTRYLIDNDVVPTLYYPTTYYPTTYLSPTTIVYDSPVLSTAIVETPTTRIVPSAPASSSTSRSAGPSTPRSEPRLSVPEDRARNLGSRPPNPPLESQPQGEQGAAPPEPSVPDLNELEPGVSPPPSPPSFEESELPGPFPDDIQLREAQRPAFGVGVPSQMLATAARIVEGRVEDASTGQPQPNATVVFSDRLTRFEDRVVQTNDQGRFVVEYLPDGDWSITVTGPDEGAPSRDYGAITISSGKIYDTLGRVRPSLVLNY